jgi:hypothetical protein
MKKIAGMAFLLIGMAVTAPAPPNQGLEIDPGSGRSALALLAGAMTIIRGRRRS